MKVCVRVTCSVFLTAVADGMFRNTEHSLDRFEMTLIIL
jgi:hypothetical protein